MHLFWWVVDWPYLGPVDLHCIGVTWFVIRLSGGFVVLGLSSSHNGFLGLVAVGFISGRMLPLIESGGPGGSVEDGAYDASVQSVLEYVCGFFSSRPANLGDEVVKCCDICVDVAIFQAEAHEPIVCLLFLVCVGESVLEMLFEVSPDCLVIFVSVI